MTATDYWHWLLRDGKAYVYRWCSGHYDEFQMIDLKQAYYLVKRLNTGVCPFRRSPFEGRQGFSA